MNRLQAKQIYKSWPSKTLVISLAVILMISCNNTNEPDKISTSPTKSNDTLPIKNEQEDLIKIEKEPVLNFISAESGRDDKKSIRYTPRNNKIKWQNFMADHLQPKSKNNPTGIDAKTIQFGDFGWHSYSSRSANTLMAQDTFEYYAISGDQLVPLRIDSLEAEITYYEDQPAHYSGYFIGYADTELATSTFIIQTNDKYVPEQFSFHTIEKEQFSITKDEHKSGQYEIVLTWAKQKYIGYTDESEINLPETSILRIKGLGDYLITSWLDDGIDQQCENNYQMFSLENGELKRISVNSYNCDI